jgi:uncharacterized protein with HEPN domain
MLGAADEIATQVREQIEDEWIEDRTKVAATSMYLIVFGEGANNLSAALKASEPDVPWANIAALRHRLAHAYFRANRRVIWQTATSSVPQLRPTLERLLNSLGREQG